MTFAVRPSLDAIKLPYPYMQIWELLGQVFQMFVHAMMVLET